jgi:hypothetical protein
LTPQALNWTTSARSSLDSDQASQLKRGQKGRTVHLPVKARDLPGRIAAGGYILHTGLDKWHVDSARAEALHRTAASALPVLNNVPPDRFVRLLAAAEIGIGSALILPVIPGMLAGAALTGFSGALLTMYARTPALRKPGSIWPSQAGTAVSKDVWMLGIGLGLVTGSLADHRNDG